MDIVKSFVNNDTVVDVLISGTVEHPLLRACDVGKVLGLRNVRSTISDYGSNEKVNIMMEHNGAMKPIIFLTEHGLYRLLMRSNMPIAYRFQQWVYSVITEIRLNGQYKLQQEMEKQMAEKERLITEKEREIEQKEREIEKLKDRQDVKAQVYLFNCTPGLPKGEQSKLKIGATERCHSRFKPYKQIAPHGRVEYALEVEPGMLKMTESFIHKLLQHYRIAGEHFEVETHIAKIAMQVLVNTTSIFHTGDKVTRELQIQQLGDAVTQVMHNIWNCSKRDMSTQTIEHEMPEVIDNPRPFVKASDTALFDQFVEECCEVRPDAEVATVDIAGQFRIWSKQVSKENYHALLDYLKVRFRAIRMNVQNENRVVNGYRGVTLKPIDYKPSSPAMTDAELFVFLTCKFAPGAKILMADLVNEYKNWKGRVGKTESIYDCNDLKTFMNNCPFVLQALLWTVSGNGTGYYGISMKSDTCVTTRITSSTAKIVEKRDTQTHEVLDTWITVAKAAQAEGISAAKMSRMLKQNDRSQSYYYLTK